VKDDLGASDLEHLGWALYDARDGRPRYWTRSRIVAVVTASFTGLRYERAELPPDERRPGIGAADDPYGQRFRRVILAWVLGGVLVIALGIRLAGGEVLHQVVIRLHVAVKPLLDRFW
jgi:hypothetical protein